LHTTVHQLFFLPCCLCFIVLPGLWVIVGGGWFIW
jgi:hypothetical protein